MLLVRATLVSPGMYVGLLLAFFRRRAAVQNTKSGRRFAPLNLTVHALRVRQPSSFLSDAWSRVAVIGRIAGDAGRLWVALITGARFPSARKWISPWACFLPYPSKTIHIRVTFSRRVTAHNIAVSQELMTLSLFITMNYG